MKAFQFDQDEAVRYGVPEAIFLWRLKWWLKENRIKGRNQHDGRTWSYDSAADLAQVFRFWSEPQVRRIIASLVEQGAVVKSNFSPKANDHTLWLALADESALETADEEAAAGAGSARSRRAQKLASRDLASRDLASRNRQAKSGDRPDGIVSRPHDSVSRPDEFVRSYKEHLKDSTSEDAVYKNPPPEAPCDPAAGPARPATGNRPATDGSRGPATDNHAHPAMDAAAASSDFVERMRLQMNALGLDAPSGWIEAKAARYGPAAFESQVRWLPRRSACTLLVLAAALRDNYEAPTGAGPTDGIHPAAGTRTAGVERVTRIGRGRLSRPEILTEIRKHGLTVVLREMAEYHEGCRRNGTPDDVLSNQCRMIESLSSATMEQVEAWLGGARTPAEQPAEWCSQQSGAGSRVAQAE